MVRKIELVKDWKDAWKFSSVRNSLFGALLMAGYAFDFFGQFWYQLPAAVQERVPHASTVGLVLFILNIFFRIFKYYKEKPNGDDESETTDQQQ